MNYPDLVIHPESVTRPDTLGVYPMTFAANIGNTADRIQAMVDAVGFPFVIADYVLQNKETIDGVPAKQANAVSGDMYRQRSLEHWQHAQRTASEIGATTLVGMGDSLAVPVIQGMQLHGDAATGQQFDAILLRDGWNLGRSTNAVFGGARYLGYQVKNGVRDTTNKLAIGAHLRSAKPAVIGEKWKDYAAGNDVDPASEVGFLQKISNVAELLQGPETRQNAVVLAGRSALEGFGINFVMLRQGLSGSVRQQEDFYRQLIRGYNNGRHDASSAVRHSPSINVDIVNGWHSDLMDPILGAADVQRTLMLSPKTAS